MSKNQFREIKPRVEVNLTSACEYGVACCAHEIFLLCRHWIPRIWFQVHGEVHLFYLGYFWLRWSQPSKGSSTNDVSFQKKFFKRLCVGIKAFQCINQCANRNGLCCVRPFPSGSFVLWGPLLWTDCFLAIFLPLMFLRRYVAINQPINQ